MLKRHIEMKIVKNPKSSASDCNTQETPAIDYVQLVRETAPVVAKYLAVSIASYVVLDTLRQVTVKLTPQH